MLHAEQEHASNNGGQTSQRRLGNKELGDTTVWKSRIRDVALYVPLAKQGQEVRWRVGKAGRDLGCVEAQARSHGIHGAP